MYFSPTTTKKKVLTAHFQLGKKNSKGKKYIFLSDRNYILGACKHLWDVQTKILLIANDCAVT